MFDAIIRDFVAIPEKKVLYVRDIPFSVVLHYKRLRRDSAMVYLDNTFDILRLIERACDVDFSLELTHHE